MANPLDAVLEKMVSSGFTAGVSAYVERGGKPLYTGMAGMADIESGMPVKADTIFRVFSMSKVITSVAALILFERGLYRMYDPVSKFLPSFKNLKVYVAGNDGKVYERPAKREIAVRDLFTMTSGVPYAGDATESERQLKKLQGKVTAKAKRENREATTREIADMIGQIPLEFDPGDHWKYGFSLDLIGALVEVWSGKTLGEFMAGEILDPLGMKDTGFFVPQNKRSRFASMYPAREDGTIKAEKVGLDFPDHAPAFESGGGGMVSTVADYAAFTRMLLNGKTLAGKQILSRKTIDLMKANHLNADQMATYSWDTQRGYGYGLGVRTLLDPAVAGCSGSVGEFGWDGYAGTWMCVDQAEDLIAVFMTQRAPGGHVQSIPLFKAALYSML